MLRYTLDTYEHSRQRSVVSYDRSSERLVPDFYIMKGTN